LILKIILKNKKNYFNTFLSKNFFCGVFCILYCVNNYFLKYFLFENLLKKYYFKKIKSFNAQLIEIF